MSASTTRQQHLGSAQLREAIAVANIPVLLLLLVQMTGDRRWLTDRYRPSRNEGLGDNRTGGLSDETQDEIRDAAVEAIERWRSGAPPAIPSPSPQMLTDLLGFSMGEEVPPEYGPMIASELGIAPDDPPPALAGPVPDGFDVLIIGAGVSGIAAAVGLERAGIPYRVIERNPGVGGTWLENRYPGCGVDTPSPIYSYSFAPREWSRYFAGRDEVLGYLQDVSADAMRDRITFGVEATSAAFDGSRQRWSVTLRDRHGGRRTVTPRFVISAVGAFNRPRFPDIPGLESFGGPCVHTARWPREGVGLTGKRVGVIGTGASAMQVVPAIAPDVARLTVFQRSPQWIAPFPYLDLELPESLRRLATEVPLYGAWYRIRWSWTFNDRLYPALQKDPAWANPDRSVNAENDLHRRYFTRYLEREVAARPELRDRILPDYPPFGKRILLDNGWFRAITRDNVSLVSEPIARVEPGAVVCASGETQPVDVLICATGFDVVRFLSSIDVRGRSGRTLRETWDDDNARAYLGTVVPDFPNLFILYGPNVQPGHGGSLVGLAEIQTRYVVDLITQMIETGLGVADCRREVWDRYNDSVDEAHENMVWTHPGMQTYYRNARGRVVVPGPFRVIDLWHRMRRADLSDYRTERVRGPAVRT